MSIYQQIINLGGLGGAPYMAVNPNAIVNKIVATAGVLEVRSIRLHFTDGSSVLAGLEVGNRVESLSIDYENGERFTEVAVEPNTDLSRVVHIQMATNKGQKFSISADQGRGREAFQFEVGSGILLGAFGNSGFSLDSLGFLLLRNIVSREISLSDMEASDNSFKGCIKYTLDNGAEWSTSAVGTIDDNSGPSLVTKVQVHATL